MSLGSTFLKIEGVNRGAESGEAADTAVFLEAVGGCCDLRCLVG